MKKDFVEKYGELLAIMGKIVLFQRRYQYDLHKTLDYCPWLIGCFFCFARNMVTQFLLEENYAVVYTSVFSMSKAVLTEMELKCLQCQLFLTLAVSVLFVQDSSRAHSDSFL